MRFRNTQNRYGFISLIFHWLTALVIFALFALGLWMVELTYYDAWYRLAPHYHKSIGLLLMLAMLLRLGWRFYSRPPEPEPSLQRWEALSARAAHILLYLLVFALGISGYLISTADGLGIALFNWFDVPATLTGIDQQEDIAGEIHKWLAWSLISLAVLHALAALKHHFLDKDRTLTKMFGK